MNTLEKAKNIQDWVLKFRRDFHRHPEPSFKEFRTSKIIAEELTNLGIEVSHIGETGVLGTLKGEKKGNVIALRADMDGLSVTEDTGLPFTSENPGFMHGCGHDCHVSMLLGAAKLLSEMKAELKGTVKFIFQPAEEVADGANQMIKGGVLKNPDVDFIFGMHIWSDVPVGKVSIKEGPMMASGDIWNLTIKGKSCHGSSPWQGVDAVTCAAAVIQGVQTLVSRFNDVRSPIVINIGTIKGGERFNVTPGTVEMTGMNRAFSADNRKKMPKWIEDMVKNICKGYNCDYEFSYDFICAPTINDVKSARLVKNSLTKLVGEENIPEFEKVMGSEDFSAYLEQIPGALLLLGCRNEAKGCCYSHHSNHFKVDEDALPIGVAAYVQVALDYLK
ncbi:M20 metallopeptidase family protein [Clostridium scatologenes]|uniref:Amidohydrolase n=1 Tax=Clostridium scatologenes TaxID=1548 RepID=A0A0E3JZ55_CLOSL|nr:amidohydrolase [Clostridium scatologenes]AKA67983.1 amidohydrolase [Clostridium scatologenes]